MGSEQEQLKEKGNKFFAEHQYHKAVDFYTQAINADTTFSANVKLGPILHSNRAAANLKIESYGSAISDAEKAIELDPKFVKAYYRKGSALIALNKYSDALKEFKHVIDIEPNNKEARSKWTECKKAQAALRLQRAIAHDEVKKSAFQTLSESEEPLIESTYTGPHLGDTITLQFVQELMEYQKSQKSLHKRYLYRLLIQAHTLLKSEPSLVETSYIPSTSNFTIFGDIHGQYYDLLNVFSKIGLPSPTNPCLFNGDFVDRGSFSVEVIILLLSLKILYPKSVFLNRGNHEAITMNRVYGFEGEVKSKYGALSYELFTELFCCLSLGHLINNKVLVVHGGLFSDDKVTLADIKKIDRFREPPDGGLMCELMWSDPQSEMGRAPSKRGVGVSFGPDVTLGFCERNGLNCVVRSHECRDEGYQVDHGGRCITVFSAPNYCDQIGNKGAVVVLKGEECKLEYVQYTAVPHPQVPPMAYSNNFSSMFGL